MTRLPSVAVESRTNVATRDRRAMMPIRWIVVVHSEGNAMTTMLTSTTVRDSRPTTRVADVRTPARHRTVAGLVRSVVSGLATAARFAGHLLVAGVSVAVLGADTEH
jgi:hypothetical protein